MAPWLSKLLFILVVFLSNIIQAITGFAGTVLAMPFSILLVGREYAKPILNAIAIVLSVILAIKNHKSIDWKYFLFICIFMGIGLTIGLLLEKYFYSSLFLKIYGGIIIAIAIYYFFVKNPIEVPLLASAIIMIFAGIIHGIFVSGGPLLIIAVKSHIKEKEKFRATLAVVWILLNSILFTTDCIHHAFDSSMGIVFCILIPTVLLSMVIGRILLKKMSNEVFMKITCVLLLISGITLLF